MKSENRDNVQLTGGDESEPRTDSLAKGMSFLLAITVIQRSIGLARNIIFCRLLDPAELGRWNLSFTLLFTIAPLVVLGLPGSFGRYVEHYRQRGQLRAFLSRIAAITVILCGVAFVVLFVGRTWFTWFVFRDPGQVHLFLLLAAALIAVIGFNVVTELFTSLRQVRVVSFLQFSNSGLFAGLAIWLINYTNYGAKAVVVAFAAACMISCLFAVPALRDSWKVFAAERHRLPRNDLLVRVIPFAAWIWLSDLLANLFSASDRYMIVHFSKTDAVGAASLVGQYHSSRVWAELIVAVASLISAVMLPYLSRDWEMGRRLKVSRDIGTTLKVFTLSMTVGGICLMLVSPVLFQWALAGKYNDGLAVLPVTLSYCLWFSMFVLAQNYLRCAENAGKVTIGLATGLVSNIVLNAILLPRYGLPGAVSATALATVIVLLCIYWFSIQSGMRLDKRILFIGVLPLLPCLGMLGAALGMLAVIAIASLTNWIFAPRERVMITRILRKYSPNRFRFFVKFFSARQSEPTA